MSALARVNTPSFGLRNAGAKARLCSVARGCLVLGASGGFCVAQSVGIPLSNPSFETPSTTYVDPRVNGWRKTPKPDWYDESGGFLWSQLAGVFLNTPAGDPDHLDNCDGAQALWMFAVPGFGLFQDFASGDWTTTNALHMPDAVFAPDTAYRLTVGVNGGGGMQEGVPLELSLYYRDDAGAQVVAAAATVTNSADAFPNHTHLTDFSVTLPAVQPGDPWAGRHLGVRLLSTVSTNLQGGYWDLDNVRLTATTVPRFALTAVVAGGGMSVRWPSAPGVVYQVSESADLRTWTPGGPPVTGTGGILSATVALVGERRFVRVTAVPQP